MKAFLILEDGTVFEGTHIGADKEIISEIVFNTSMAGYLEVLTDPSYAGQAVCMTYPLIGNYGICRDDCESLIHQIFRIFFQKSSLSGSQEACDQIDRYHISSFLSVSLICIVITSIILSHNTSRNARKVHIPLPW